MKERICTDQNGEIPSSRFARMLLVVLFAFFHLGLLLAQEGAWHPVYKNYTSVDGLPSMEVYHSFQDRDGYMWFATDHGVARS